MTQAHDVWCPHCGARQPYSRPEYGPTHCVYCGTDLTPLRPQRFRWVSRTPPWSPAKQRPIRSTAPYRPPARYPVTPRWGFAPSIWKSLTPPTPPAPVAPLRELRSARLLARCAVALFVIAAAAEIWRYVLIAVGRTEVLLDSVVRASDALVISASWGALLFAAGTAVTLVPALGRLTDWVTARVQVEPPRNGERRLILLCVPVWNLWGAGVVLAEIDALLRADIPVASKRSAAPMRWRQEELPAVRVPQPAAAPEPGPATTHRRPGRLISWWWVAWGTSGLLALALLVFGRHPGSVQAQANLVELHVVADLLAAGVAALTVAVLGQWLGRIAPVEHRFPVGWIVRASV